MEDLKEIIKKASAGPYSIECLALKIKQDVSTSIDMWETGQKIKKICLEHGYTVRQLQEELDIGFQSVYAWFAGSAVPSLDNMYQLSSLFEVPMEQMIAASPQIVCFYLQLGKTEENRTAKTMWKYYARELRSCMCENAADLPGPAGLFEN